MADEETGGGLDRFIKRWAAHFSQVASASYKALAVSLLVGAYLLQPSVRFLDAYQAYTGVFIFGLGLLMCALCRGLRHDNLSYVAGFLAMGAGVFLFGDAIETAVQRAAANDARCSSVEAALLAGTSRRSDLAELFTALGCTARSNAPVKL